MHITLLASREPRAHTTADKATLSYPFFSSGSWKGLSVSTYRTSYLVHALGVGRRVLILPLGISSYAVKMAVTPLDAAYSSLFQLCCVVPRLRFCTPKHAPVPPVG